jgi:hypothetical protein
LHILGPSSCCTTLNHVQQGLPLAAKLQGWWCQVEVTAVLRVVFACLSSRPCQHVLWKHSCC